MTGRVLVTGATGFVGSHLARHLVAAGIPLTLAVRATTPAPLRAYDTRIVAVGGIGSRTEWAGALDSVDAVIHAAAHVHVAPERAAAEAAIFEEVNAEGTARLFDAAAQAGVRLFVFLSSVTVLGDASAPGRPLTDDATPDPRTPYARSKWHAEQRLAAAAARHPATRLVVLRPPLVCGPGVKGNLRTLLRVAMTRLPVPLGGIANRRTLLSLETLAGAIDAVLASREGAGTFLLGDAEPVSTSDIVAALRAGLDRPPGLILAPVEAFRRLAGIAGRPGMAARLFGDLEIDSSRFRHVFGPFASVDTLSSLRATSRAFAASG